MRLCELFPRELRYGQRLCRSQCAPAADRPHRVPSHTLCFTRAPHTAEAAPTRNQEPTVLRAGAERGAYGLACRAEGGKSRGAPCPACHFKAEPLRPTTAARTGPPDPGGRSQARRRPACGHARRKPARTGRFRRLPARVPPRLHRLSQLHAEGRCSTGVRGRSISLGAQSARVLTACRSGPASLEDRAWCSWSLRCCAGRTLQTGGQRSHRTTEDRGSQQSASMDARPTPLDRRRSARAAAESGALGSSSAAVSARHELRWRLQSCRMSFRFT